MLPDLATFASHYEPMLKDYYAKYQADQTYLVKNFWQQWIDTGVKGIESAAPFAGSSGTTDQTQFSPLPLEGVSPAASVAALLVAAFENYMNAIVWPPMAPVAPFSAITSVVTSPTGLAAASAILLAGMIAELAVVPPPATAFADKANAFAALFNTAAAASGIMITGLGIGSPPPPLVVPLSPVQ